MTIASATASSSSTAVAATQPERLDSSWVAGPVIGSILGIATVFIVIFFTRRQRRKEAFVDSEKPTPDVEDYPPDKAQLHSDCIPTHELDNSEVILPVEMPAVEPVGSELSMPREGSMEWPIPLSPLPLLFALTEMKDNKAESIKTAHDTYYNP
jgi:hypothetical protein